MPNLEPKHYVVETNRSSRTTAQNCRRLERKGFETIRLGHQPTAFIVVDHQRQRWQDTRVVLARLADTPQASVVVMSGQTGNVFQRNRRGNQPNRWVRRYPL